MKRSWGTDSQEEELDFNAHPARRRTPPLISSLKTSVSPPPKRKSVSNQKSHELASIEAGEVEVTDHLGIFSTKLSQHTRPLNISKVTPRLAMNDYVNLYRRNNHPTGRHFVIHQHDHPIAGTHYDLRLQFSETSSVSWSIMYGLPGDPNSVKLNRNATETRVHCLWNHLIETASAKTGSLIIWDTGEYEVLPYTRATSCPQTDESQADSSDGEGSHRESISDSTKLKEAFKNRKIRLRLHGNRLPAGYTLLLRMDKSTDYARPARKGPKRRRATKSIKAPPPPASTSTSESPSPPPPDKTQKQDVTDDKLSVQEPKSEADHANHSDDNVDYQIRKNNAYPGSSNTIGSIHQRRWYLSMDRESSGFEPRKITGGEGASNRMWVRSGDGSSSGLKGFEPFYVRGPEVERSVVTGRRGQDVLEDEGVEGFIARKGWRAVVR
ncbi:hypothetical protein PMG11_01747 [Penicillium brasilianum]|uniref:DNA ligase D 3'-phosphoesterase domain-containing protein n=1 Tax=Penicillium brasilianum TaxID=104259 RepID=A0A0F7TFB5_PENBI|nr:hypothetical protein PMG11_01747 [Penicillium brasilianum]